MACKQEVVKEFSHTKEARRGRVLLDGLCHVVLDSLPDLPLKARMQDVEGLHGMKPPVSLILGEDGVVCFVVPLKRKNRHI